MSAHAAQAFSIAHCTDLEDLPTLTRPSNLVFEISVVFEMNEYNVE